MLQSFRDKVTLAKRNRKKQHKLAAADVILLRYPKSGVTWLRMMVSRVFAQKLDRDIPYLAGSKRFEKLVPEAPCIFIAMDNIGLTRAQMLRRLDGKKAVLLVRDPRDITVSLYFHLTKRSTRQERLTFGVPDDLSRRSLFDFMMDPQIGLARVIDFEEFWRKAFEGRPDTLCLQYEDLRQDAEAGLAKMMALMGTEVSARQISDAVAYSSFDNMKQLEARRSFTVGPLQPGNPEDPDSFKVRKGEIGGFRQYFSAKELAEIDRLMHARSRRVASAAEL